jgi:hypothetical protein
MKYNLDLLRRVDFQSSWQSNEEFDPNQTQVTCEGSPTTPTRGWAQCPDV